MATSLFTSPPLEKNQNAFPALLHAVHLLSLPVRMGIRYIARSQMYFWSCQFSICALECGVFLWRWLQQIENIGYDTPGTYTGHSN